MIGILLIVGVCVAVLAFYRWARANDNFFKSRNIQHLEPTFLLGNTGGFYIKQSRADDFINNLYNSFPASKIIGMFDLRKPLYMIRDPDAIKQLTVKDFDHFENHQAFGDDKFENMFTRSLIMLRGEKWRHMRSTLSPAFTGSKMRLMFELVNECAATMTETLLRKDDRNQLNVEVKELLSKYTMDVIATTAFGIKVNSFENEQNEFMVYGKKLLDMNNFWSMTKFFLASCFPSLFKLTGLEIFDRSVDNFFKKIVLGTMDVRERENIYRPDMIQLLMPMWKGKKLADAEADSAHLEHDSTGFATVQEINVGGSSALKQDWSEDEIVAQCFIFFAAGFDTVASAMSFIAHELAVNPEVQQKLFDECTDIQQSLDGKALPYDVLQKMKYMDQVVSEGLRMWPPAFFTDRVCNKDYEYNDGETKVLINSGTPIWLPIYGLHHDEKFFPNPEKFEPERFSDAKKANIVPGSYIPFGVGPRNCIASRFALMEVKALIYHLVLNFELEPNEKTQIPLKLAKSPNSSQTEQGINLYLKPRVTFT